VNGSWTTEKPENYVELAVGTPVRYWPGFREGNGRISVTTSPVYYVGNQPCVELENYHKGGVCLTHVEVLPYPEGAR
jgi:hypothetical protein